MTVVQAAYIVAIFACLYAAQAATLIQNTISINGTYQQSAALPAVCVLVGSSSGSACLVLPACEHAASNACGRLFHQTQDLLYAET